MIRCIIFDQGNTILKANPARSCRILSKHCCLSPPGITWFAPWVYQKLETGKITKKQLYKIAKKELGLKNISQQRFEHLFADMFTNNAPVQKIARKLKKDYKLILLSNTSAIHFDHIRKHFPILNIFDHHVLSYREGCMKPHLKIYRIALKRSKFRPEECVFIDDREENVAAARSVGIKGIHFTTVSKLKEDLRKLGVKV